MKNSIDKTKPSKEKLMNCEKCKKKLYNGDYFCDKCLKEKKYGDEKSYSPIFESLENKISNLKKNLK